MSSRAVLYASLDLGGTKLAGAIADARGTILAERSIPTRAEDGDQAVLARAADLVRELAAEVGAQPAALGVGLPGLVDIKKGLSLFLPNLPGNWRHVPVAETLSASLGCPVKVLNDVRMAALGELVYGLGHGAGTMVFIALGTGIGGGLAINGRLRLGALDAAGEIGHQTLMPDGPLCGCGNRGCLEALASGTAVSAEGVRLVLAGQAPNLRALVNGDLAAITPRSMLQAADLDTAVRAALLRAAGYIGIGVANAVTLLNPDLVVLGGGMAELGAILFETVRSVVRERVCMFPVTDLRIEPSALGGRAGILGGIALAAKRGRMS
ncbi:MAG: ROK family protein [Anaerolineae bacterium]